MTAVETPPKAGGATLAGAPLTGPVDWNKGQPERETASGAYREVATD